MYMYNCRQTCVTMTSTMEGPSQFEVNLENPLVYLEWEHYTTLTVGMQHAQAVVVGNKVYVGGGMTTGSEGDTNIYVFDHTIERPMVTPIPTPELTRWSTLASFHSQLVLAGGTIDSVNAMDKLWALQDDGTWDDERFPPMPQACWGASAVSSGDHLLIAGGVVSDYPLTPLDTVQIYNASSKQWIRSIPLPRSCYFMKSVLLNDNWYLAGGRWQYSKIFKASLKSLIETSDIREKEIWKSLPGLSRRRCCSISACHGQLMAVGGVTNSGPTCEIQVYSTKKRSWIEVEYMPKACDSTCTIVLPTEEILLIGGNTLPEYQQHKFSRCVRKARTKVIDSLERFNQNALKHLEVTAGISVCHYFMSERMDPNKDDEWLLSNLKSTHDQPALWRDLLGLLRDRGMYDEANYIEQLITNTAPAKRIDTNTAVSEQYDDSKVSRNWKNTLDEPATWRDLLGLLRDRRMSDMAKAIEHLFANIATPESPPPSSVHEPMLQPTNEQVLNTKLEREYELKEELGKGGFGVVYHVKNKFDRGHFALKVTKLPNSKHQQEKVMREVHALVTLDHPRILRYYISWAARVRDKRVVETLQSQNYPTTACAEYAAYTIASADDSLSTDPHDDEGGSSEQELPYCLHIQTQLCNKDTLKDWLKSNTDNRKKKTVFGFFEQIHDAVVYIHQKGLLHRDLKPSNVFFSREGGSVKVGDFGLVAGVNVDDDTTHGTLSMEHKGQQVLKQTHSGHMGTQPYMAPDQLKERYDEKVDIYALGVIFFELNCPFPNEEQRKQVLMNLHSQQKLPSWFSTKLPHQAELIELLLASDPKSRPTAEEISKSVLFKALKEESEVSEAANIPKLDIPLFPVNSSPGTCTSTGNGSTSEVGMVVPLHPGSLS